MTHWRKKIDTAPEVRSFRALWLGVTAGLAMAAIFLLFAGKARAECLQWGRDTSGTRVCMMDDAVNRNPIIPETQCGALTGCAGMNTSPALSTCTCDDGWTPVFDPTMRAMCARELRKPR